jgi:hypothetical protein
MADLKYPFKLLFAKDPIGNKLTGIHGLSISLVDNYQHLIKRHEISFND